MGALPPTSPWIPEDDLLLKNAVEAGASLESLAKGAIRFSRRFTIREVQERWHSLLYDPVVSVEAAEQMIALERSSSNLTFSKSSKLETTRDGRESRKRKYKSVRRSYYETRKRIHSHPLNQSDLDFFVPPVENYYGDGTEEGGRSNILEDPMGSRFEVGNTDLDGLLHEFDNREKGKLQNYPFEQCDQIPQTVHHNMPLGGNSSEVGGTDLSKELHAPNPVEDNIDVNTVGDSDKNKDTSMYACLEGNHVFNSPVSECEASLHHLQYSSPPPAMPEWRNTDTISAIDMAGAGDSRLRGKNPETDFESHIPSDEMKASSSRAQFDLVALSDTLLNLSDDDNDMLLMDDDGKEIDKYGLSNLLLDSPSDINDDQMLDATQVDTSVASEADIHICSSATTGQLDKSDSVLEEPKISSASDTNPQILELCINVISCSLNTEDLEVPYNDHVVFPSKAHLASLNRKGFNEVSRRDLFMKDNLHKQDAYESGLSLVNRELKRFGELHTDSQARGHKTGLNHASERNLQLSKSASLGTKSRLLGNANCSTVIIRTMASENVSRKQSCSGIPKLPVKSSDGLLNRFETAALEKKQRVQAVKNLDVNTQSRTAEERAPEAAAEPLVSNAEEQPSDYDVDEDDYDDDEEVLPSYSDAESLVLHMDLGPEDHDSYSSRQVAMYQSEEAKRAIIRWEQGVHARMHRAIASHGAFAVFYGHHSKHYIKKPEVLLGRATEDVFVDIDLGKEGRANKISRRQAIIKMDEDGEFHLRNLGKCPILVDSKELYPGQSLILTSHCFIEVREMPFIFEKYHARVKQYLDAISRNMQSN